MAEAPIEWAGDESVDGRWLVQVVRITEGRDSRRTIQLLDLHAPIPGTGGLMHERWGTFTSEADARAMAQSIIDAEAKL